MNTKLATGLALIGISFYPLKANSVLPPLEFPTPSYPSPSVNTNLLIGIEGLRICQQWQTNPNAKRDPNVATLVNECIQANSQFEFCNQQSLASGNIGENCAYEAYERFVRR
jgi:hypothetical protein